MSFVNRASSVEGTEFGIDPDAVAIGESCSVERRKRRNREIKTFGIRRDRQLHVVDPKLLVRVVESGGEAAGRRKGREVGRDCDRSPNPTEILGEAREQGERHIGGSSSVVGGRGWVHVVQCGPDKFAIDLFCGRGQSLSLRGAHARKHAEAESRERSCPDGTRGAFQKRNGTLPRFVSGMWKGEWRAHHHPPHGAQMSGGRVRGSRALQQANVLPANTSDEL